MSWVPSNDFEEEIVSMQPDHNFIFGSLLSEPEVFYPRPKSHLEYAAAQKKQQKEQNKQDIPNKNHKLNVISQVQRIAGTKPLGEQPTIEDWNDTENLEIETVAMMRHFGLGPSIEEPLDEERTIATHPIPDKMRIMQNGKKRIPILFDEGFFKLKPRITSNAEEERGMESSRSSTSTPTAEGFNNSSTSFNSSNGNVSDVAITAPKSQPQESWRDINNCNASYTKSSDDGNSRFETANDEGSFYTASNTSKEYVPSRSWYQSRSRIDKRNINTFNNRSSNDGISASSSTASVSFSSARKPQRVQKQNQREEEKQGPRFYTAKELYEKKRCN